MEESGTRDRRQWKSLEQTREVFPKPVELPPSQSTYVKLADLTNEGLDDSVTI
jgi:hypothetical protein